MKDSIYYVVKQKAIPEVLVKVVQVKQLLEKQPNITVQEAAETVGISRSSFYKYKDDIFPFHDDARGKTVTFMVQMLDRPGGLSQVLGIMAEYNANILTIHQAIPINGIANFTVSMEVLSITKDINEMFHALEAMEGLHYVKILARE